MVTPSFSFVRRAQLPLFFTVAYLLSWLVWGTYIAQQSGLLTFHLPESFFAYFALTLAVLIVAGLTGGRTALIDIARRVVRWRVGFQWYVLALLVPIGLPLLTAGIYRLLGGSVPMGVDVPLGSAIVYFFAFGAKALITEEVAWRGFALPRLLVNRSALSASIILGLLWGIWHTPLFFIAGTGQSKWPYLGFLLFAVAESILITWIFNNTRGSVLLATLFHAASDAALSFSGVLFGGQLLFWLAVGVTSIAALIVVLVEGPARLSRKNSIAEAMFIPAVEDSMDKSSAISRNLS